MLAARVMSEHFDAVTLLERGHFPEAPAARKGLPRGRHAHVLLEGGRGGLERLLPGLTGELVRAGAAPLDATRGIAWLSPAGWYVRFPGDLRRLGSSRDVLSPERVAAELVKCIRACATRHAKVHAGLIECPAEQRA